MTAQSTAETIVVGGLNDPAEIAIDRWGIPHFRASTRDDLFFVQGFNAARDRLWQIDLWRKRGLGLLAADFGPGYLAQDYAGRLFLYRGDMAAEWASYAPDTKTICQAFVAGINVLRDVDFRSTSIYGRSKSATRRRNSCSRCAWAPLMPGDLRT